MNNTQDALRMALEASKQCITDFIELYKRGASNIVMDEAVKSLRDDALKKVNAALSAQSSQAPVVPAWALQSQIDICNDLRARLKAAEDMIPNTRSLNAEELLAFTDFKKTMEEATIPSIVETIMRREISGDALKNLPLSSSHQPQAQQPTDELDLARFVNGVREFVLGQLHGILEQTGYDRVRAVDPAWLANTVLESQGQPLPTKPQVYIGESQAEAFNRFCECCEDSDSGGHDVSKEMMRQLCEIGLVRQIGFGRHETTRYGDAIRSMKLNESQLPCVELRKALEALQTARRYVESQNGAEGMLDGLRGRKPRPSDDDLAQIERAIEALSSDKDAAQKPVVEKWAMFFNGHFLGGYWDAEPGFVDDWLLYDSSDEAQKVCDANGSEYSPRKVFIYDAAVSKPTNNQQGDSHD